MMSVINHSFTTGDVVTWKGGASADPSTVSYTVPVNDSKNAFVEYATVAYRYWRLAWTLPASRAISIGEVVSGSAMHMQRQYNWGSRAQDDYQASKLVTPYGSEWSYYFANKRAFTMSYDWLDDGDVGDWRYIMDDCKGATYPILIVPDPTSYRCYYGSMPTSYSSVEQSLQLQRPGSIDFVEQARAAVQS